MQSLLAESQRSLEQVQREVAGRGQDRQVLQVGAAPRETATATCGWYLVKLLQMLQVGGTMRNCYYSACSPPSLYTHSALLADMF